MKHNPQAVTSAMQLYFSGESLRNTQKSLRLLGVDVSHKTIYLWIRRYVGLMQKYLERMTPQGSNTWRADEMFLKIKGDPKYLFALLDAQTTRRGFGLLNKLVATSGMYLRLLRRLRLSSLRVKRQ